MIYSAQNQESPVHNVAQAHTGKMQATTGRNIHLSPGRSKNAYFTPTELMAVIARALNMSTDTYRMQSRERDIVELRFLASLFMRSYFPYVTLRQIAVLFDKKDHSSIINGISRANDLLYIGDAAFVSKYELASAAVDQWIAQHNSMAA